MDKLNFDFFGLFGALVPGIPFLISISFLVTGTEFSYSNITTGSEELSGVGVTLCIFLAYVIGFSFHYPSYEIFKWLVVKWGVKRTLGYHVSFGKRETEIAQIREKRPENFKVLTNFFALRQMSYNLFFSIALSILVIVISSFFNGWSKDLWSLVLCGLSFCILVLRRAVDFHQRCHLMIDAAMNIIP